MATTSMPRSPAPFEAAYAFGGYDFALDGGAGGEDGGAVVDEGTGEGAGPVVAYTAGVGGDGTVDADGEGDAGGDGLVDGGMGRMRRGRC